MCRLYKEGTRDEYLRFCSHTPYKGVHLLTYLLAPEDARLITVYNGRRGFNGHAWFSKPGGVDHDRRS